jgi:hypothetical protein
MLAGWSQSVRTLQLARRCLFVIDCATRERAEEIAARFA